MPYIGDVPSAITHTLWALPPVEVALDALRLHFLDASVPPSQVLVALNGTLVGLCVSSPEREGGVEESVGLGLVRAVNAEKRLLYIITPLGVQQLQRVDVLVRGRGLEVPLPALNPVASGASASVTTGF